MESATFKFGEDYQSRQAEIEVLEGLEQMLCANDSALFSIASGLENYVDSLLGDCTKCLDKIIRKLTRLCDKDMVSPADDLDRMLTTIRICLDGNMDNSHWLLTQLAIKSGAIQIGQDLGGALANGDDATNGPQFGGTLVLSVKEAIPFFECICEVLKEIRNRMPPVVIQESEELPALEVIPKYGELPHLDPVGGYKLTR